MQSTILFVDDEPSILSAIKRVFRKSPYKILTTDSVTKALELMQTTPISVLVSDYTMPGKTGAELLAAARDIRPEMTRIILSGNGDQEATIQSINRGAASRFLTKPWDDITLRCEIDEAVAEWEATRYVDVEKDLLNQSAFIDTVDSMVSTDQLNNHAVVYFRMRDFDKIQRNLGRDLVTEFLRHISPSMNSLNSCLAFGLLDDCHFCALVSLEVNSDDIAAILSSFIDQFPRSIVYDDQKFQIMFDAGYCSLTGENGTSKELIDKAQMASKLAKQSGASSFFVHKPSMDEQKKNLQIMENGLADALAENEFVLYYQPKIDTVNATMHGAEALIRWNSKFRGMVPPFEFIPLAEQDDTIIDIGHWVMVEAAQQWVKWFGAHELNPTVSVNVSGKQLQDSTFMRRLESVLDETGIDASSFELEITETLMMEDMKATVGVLKEIKSLGVMLSIDDFGTGYSSLSHLSLLPVDTLKIDRSFILPMQESKESRNLVRNLINLGHDLGVDIVAEGVEEEEQLDMLKGYGCDVIQGYYYSPPVPVTEYAQLIEKYHPAPSKATEDQQFRFAS